MKAIVFAAVIISCLAFLEASVARNRRGFLDFFNPDCKEEGDDCDGIPKCCGDLVCYWEDGISAITDGVCVGCIGEGNACQRDKQCCEPYACIKEKLYHPNGLCQEKLGSGEHCHDNDDCKSANCEREYFLSLHGACE